MTNGHFIIVVWKYYLYALGIREDDGKLICIDQDVESGSWSLTADCVHQSGIVKRG